MRPTKDEWGIELARVTARRATCLRRHVGCVLVDIRGHVLATGYNGVAAGLPHCNEETQWISQDGGYSVYGHACSGARSPSGTNLEGCQAIHAEQNALLQCRNVWEIHTCYVTVSPCVSCVKMLLNTSCTRIVFGEKYPHDAARQLWEESGRAWIKLSGQ